MQIGRLRWLWPPCAALLALLVSAEPGDGPAQGFWLTAAAEASSPTLASRQPGGDRELGEYLSAECVTCHQLSGAYRGIPPIVGWPADAFVNAMHDYRMKVRPNAVMQTIAAKLSDEEIAALAAYFASVQPKS